MKLHIAPVFAVPLAQKTLESSEALNRSLIELILARERQGNAYANPHPSLKLQPGVFESDFDLFSWPEQCIQQLKAFCWASLGEALQELNGYTGRELQQIEIFSHTWFHVTRRPGFTILHTHPMASWSGVYCVTPGTACPDHPESGVLRFHNPHHYSNYFMDPGNSHLAPPYHHGTWSTALKPGQLILFPSWLQHEVLPYHGESPRITIAFNCWFGIKRTV